MYHHAQTIQKTKATPSRMIRTRPSQTKFHCMTTITNHSLTNEKSAVQQLTPRYILRPCSPWMMPTAASSKYCTEPSPSVRAYRYGSASGGNVTPNLISIATAP